MPKKSNYEMVLDAEINKREHKLNLIRNEKIKLDAELETLNKSKELFIQAKKREKITNGKSKLEGK